MNLKNLMMWSVIVLLVVGLFQLFKNPKNSMVSDKMPFSEFLKNIDDGRVVQVVIRGNDIEGILSNGTAFSTYAPNDPNLVEKLTSKGVSITASPIEDKMPSLFGVLLSWFPNIRRDNPVVVLVYQVTEPVLSRLRRFIPPLGAFDLTPMIAIILVASIGQLVAGLVP